MSTFVHEHYPTLTDKERHLLFLKIKHTHKLTCMRGRLLKKETRQFGKRLVAKRIQELLDDRAINGEWFACRQAPWRCVIKVNDIVYLLGISERYAQEKLRELKLKLGKSLVTVKEFCVAYKFEEEYIQRLLNDGDAREMNAPKWQKKIDALNNYWEREMKKIRTDMEKEKEEEEEARRKETYTQKDTDAEEEPDLDSDLPDGPEYPPKNKTIIKGRKAKKKRPKGFDGDEKY